MKPIELNNPAEIQEFLANISFTGEGFTSESLLGDVFDAGLDWPDFVKAEGEDPNAAYKGQTPAWGKYHIRQGKRVFMIYGGEGGRPRRSHFMETP